MPPLPSDTSASLLTQLNPLQQAAQMTISPTLQQRRHWLNSLKQALREHTNALQLALAQDYGHRSHHDSLMADILPVISGIHYHLQHLRRWLKPQPRHSGVMLFGSRLQVHYQPKGVCGILVPWNFPVMLSLGPLTAALAAGNRVMLKLSEFTPHSNQVIRQLLAQAFTAEEVVVVEGDATVAAAFAALPFDHLLFTGATPVGKAVMAAAAQNLTPVTLELGGKSPAIIAPDMPVERAVSRLLYSKTLNAGQICVAPDYVLCPQDKVAAFISTWQQQFRQMYPDFGNNRDYSFIINERHRQRLQRLLGDALDKGAQCHSATGDSVDTQHSRHWPTLLLTNVSDDMAVLQEEIFGPLLPIVAYHSLPEALLQLQQQPRPLALYLFTEDQVTEQHVLQHSRSGAMCVNDSLYHVAADDAPFGGTGASGMGHYHGEEGFREFSHARTVLKKGRWDTARYLQPPYGRWWQTLLLRWLLR